ERHVWDAVACERIGQIVAVAMEERLQVPVARRADFHVMLDGVAYRLPCSRRLYSRIATSRGHACCDKVAGNGQCGRRVRRLTCRDRELECLMIVTPF